LLRAPVSSVAGKVRVFPLTLTSGTRLGVFVISSPLGAGGMGEVYRARDTTLGRDVAIKILPADFSADADRLARFRREAHVLAALNHPNLRAVISRKAATDKPCQRAAAERRAGNRTAPSSSI